MNGFITERDFQEAEAAFPGIEAFYRFAEVHPNPKERIILALKKDGARGRVPADSPASRLARRWQRSGTMSMKRSLQVITGVALFLAVLVIAALGLRGKAGSARS